MLSRLALAALLVLPACASTPAPAPSSPSPAASAASASASPAALELPRTAAFEIVLLGSGELPKVAEIEKLLRARFPELAVVKEYEDLKGPTVLVTEVHGLHPVPEGLLEFQSRGLDPRERKLLLRPHDGVSLHFGAPAADGRRLLRLADSAVLALTEKGGLFVDDIEARIWFSSEEWKKVARAWEGDVPQVRRHVVMHGYEDGQFYRFVTLGMRKMGLPDLAMSGLPYAASGTIGDLLHAVAQELARSGVPPGGELTLTSPETGQPVKLKLVPASPEVGDTDNLLLSLDTTAFPGRTEQERISALATLWSGGPEPMVQASSHDAELQAASAAARKLLLEGVKPRFLKGLREREILAVKGSFGGEYMWLTVRAWEGDEITGLLIEDAFRDPNLKAGSEVRLDEDDVFDYFLINPDGTREGGTTDEVLRRRAR